MRRCTDKRKGAPHARDQLGYLGMHPPTFDDERGKYEWQFIILGVVSLLLISWQAVLINNSKEASRQVQEKLQSAIDGEQKAANVARVELTDLKEQINRLRSDLTAESARREQAQKDMALIVQKVGAETRVGVADDFRKSLIKVDIPLGKKTPCPSPK